MNAQKTILASALLATLLLSGCSSNSSATDKTDPGFDNPGFENPIEIPGTPTNPIEDSETDPGFSVPVPAFDGGDLSASVSLNVVEDKGMYYVSGSVAGKKIKTQILIQADGTIQMIPNIGRDRELEHFKVAIHGGEYVLEINNGKDVVGIWTPNGGLSSAMPSQKPLPVHPIETDETIGNNPFYTPVVVDGVTYYVKKGESNTWVYVMNDDGAVSPIGKAERNDLGQVVVTSTKNPDVLVIIAQDENGKLTAIGLDSGWDNIAPAGMNPNKLTSEQKLAAKAKIRSVKAQAKTLSR